MLFQLLPPTSSTTSWTGWGIRTTGTIPRTIEYYLDRPQRVDAVQGGPLLGAGPR